MKKYDWIGNYPKSLLTIAKLPIFFAYVINFLPIKSYFYRLFLC